MPEAWESRSLLTDKEYREMRVEDVDDAKHELENARTHEERHYARLWLARTQRALEAITHPDE